MGSELPVRYTAGDDFSYSSWPANTSIMLASVPWDTSYRDVLWFDYDRDLYKYLDSLDNSHVVTTSAKVVTPQSTVRLEIPFAEAQNYNYMAVTNGAYPVTFPNGSNSQAFTFFYFVTDARYVSGNVTEFVIQLDVWQSYSRRVKFGRAYVERGHIGISNQMQMANYGRKYLSIPEGLDLGAEYVTCGGNNKRLSGDTLKNMYKIFICATADFVNSGGTVDNPKLESANGSLFENLPNGCDIYSCDGANYKLLLKELKTKPWVAQSIISVTAVPSEVFENYDKMTVGTLMIGAAKLLVMDVSTPKARTLINTKNFRWYLDRKLPRRYRNLKKFLTAPYSWVELTIWNGQHLMLRPESVNSDNLAVNSLIHSAPPAPRCAFYVLDYNSMDADSSGTTKFPDGSFKIANGDFLDNAFGITDFPHFMVVNDQYISFMASNRNSLAYQHSSADWSQTKALRGADTAFNQAGASMDAARQSTDIANTTRNQQMAVNMGSQALGAVGALATGNVAGAVAAGANAAMSGISTQIQNNAANQQLAVQQNLSGFMRDTNRDLAQFAISGDYQNTVAGINAKVQDARLTQPGVAGQTGGDAFLLSTIGWNISTRYKMIDMTSMVNIGEYWLRYGYAIQRYISLPDKLQAMEAFTYWKCSDTAIAGMLPEGFKQAIRGIFERGVTVWHVHDDILNRDIGNNAPLKGIEY